MDKCIIFDFDGVIIDSHQLQMKALRESYNQLVGDGEPPYEQFFRCSGDSLVNIFRKLQLPNEMISVYRKVSRENTNLIVIVEGMYELLQTLRKNYYCVLCTGKDRERTLEILRSYNMDSLFSMIVCSDDVKKSKPNNESIKLILDKLKILPEKTIMIGDGINDIICANSSNVFSIATSWGDTTVNDLMQAKPSRVVHNVKQLYKAIDDYFNVEYHNNKVKYTEIYDVLVISDFTVEHFLDSEIKNIFCNNDINVNIKYIPYNSYREKEIELKQLSFKYVIIWLNMVDFNDSEPYSIKIEDAIYENLVAFYYELKEHIHAPVIWIGFDSYEDDMSLVEGHIYNKYNKKRNLNIRMLEVIRRRDVMIDLENLIALNGISSSYNINYKYRWGCVYEKSIFKLVAAEIFKQHKILRSITPKCIILDCDNVLWGGTISEDGIDKINLGNIGIGRLYQDFQRFILQLYYHGIILAIASKNDLLDVKNIFENHSGMILKKKHIACFEVNWQNKADSIKRISENLNISFDSIVFVDDSIFEIKLINSILPMVKTILFEKENVLSQFECFNLYCEPDSSNLMLRNETYKSNVKREELKTNIKSYEEYLEALEMKINVKKAEPIEYSRIAELSLRTNKGTNGKRYTLEELKAAVSDHLYSLYSVEVSDKFGNLGIVGAIGVKEENEGSVLDLFCLSCRAFGREIENVMISEICIKHNISLIKKYSTGKNAEFFSKVVEKLLENYNQINIQEKYI